MKISPQTVAPPARSHPWRTIGVWVVLLFGAFALISALLSGALTTQASFSAVRSRRSAPTCSRSAWACRRRRTRSWW